MGQARIPLYAYVDETGNTGHNVFDEHQPDFFTAAFITAGDFDLIYTDPLRVICNRINIDELHANELGVDRIEQIAGCILALLTKSKGSFFVSRVEKRYLVATKIFDAIFDSGENAAVAWHHYNFEHYA